MIKIKNKTSKLTHSADSGSPSRPRRRNRKRNVFVFREKKNWNWLCHLTLCLTDLNYVFKRKKKCVFPHFALAATHNTSGHIATCGALNSTTERDHHKYINQFSSVSVRLGACEHASEMNARNVPASASAHNLQNHTNLNVSLNWAQMEHLIRLNAFNHA